METKVEKNQLEEYLSLRKIEGISENWYKQVKRELIHYLDSVEWVITKSNTLDYVLALNKKYSVCTYRKKVYQIRKLLEYLSMDWASHIKLPDEPHYIPKHITLENIDSTLNYFKGHRYETQLKALIYLGASSGMRAHEIYQLRPEDLDIDNRIIHINHNPKNGQSTKTKQSRISFFTTEAKEVLEEYLKFFNNGSGLKCLFSYQHISRMFKDAPIQVKDLRKYFSQTWTRKNGNSSVKRILMGHSLKGDVDLGHYNVQSTEELKQIYDSVMLK